MVHICDITQNPVKTACLVGEGGLSFLDDLNFNQIKKWSQLAIQKYAQLFGLAWLGLVMGRPSSACPIRLA